MGEIKNLEWQTIHGYYKTYKDPTKVPAEHCLKTEEEDSIETVYDTIKANFTKNP